ncbi:hypothetical protein DERP_009249 [Dermatophagoides pteronyssinus]|uniref:Uncharacterized protein n=1 Tax=Dermatophagoides pteronyssinus TaxID=6956 RepID=A0ABQ8JR23_DERPT|nr:hypothetical protein DERP_009249 [Dermatophagoides pteronyssinus]
MIELTSQDNSFKKRVHWLFIFCPAQLPKLREREKKKQEIPHSVQIVYVGNEGVKGLEFLKFFCLISYVLTTPNKQTLIKTHTSCIHSINSKRVCSFILFVDERYTISIIFHDYSCWVNVDKKTNKQKK